MTDRSGTEPILTIIKHTSKFERDSDGQGNGDDTCKTGL